MDQATDELASYFDGRMPKVLVTTSADASAVGVRFVGGTSIWAVCVPYWLSSCCGRTHLSLLRV